MGASTGTGLAATVPEVEGNDTPASATALDPANQCYARGSAAITAGDVDLWSFGASVGTSVWTETDTGGTQIGTPTSRDTNLDVLGVGGTSVIENDDDDGTGNGGDGSIESGLASLVAGATFPQTGTGFVRVKAFSTTATVNPYRLFVATTTKTPVAEQEPNNTLPTANPVLGCDTPITGSISPSLDVDQYSFQLVAGETVFIVADADPDRNGGVDLKLQLTGPGGGDLITGGVDSSIKATAAAEGFDFDATTTGLYTLRVEGFNAAATGTYRVLVATPDRTPPTTSITGGPNGPTSDTRPVFLFNGSDDKTAPGALSFECSLTPQGQAPAFAGCGAPAFQPGGALANGAYTFAVRATDATGNVGGAATRNINIGAGSDTVKPSLKRLKVRVATRTVKGQHGRRVRRIRVVVVSFKASDAKPGKVAKIQCKLDRGRYRKCKSGVSFRGVSNGKHKITVRVTDTAGNVKTASKKFTVGPRRKRG
jgi:hypothetical protein